MKFEIRVQNGAVPRHPKFASSSGISGSTRSRDTGCPAPPSQIPASVLQRDGRTHEHPQEWIQLQVDILEKTADDPLKAEMQLGAIQQMYFKTEASRQHITWLEKNIRLGLFKEKSSAESPRTNA